MDLVVTTPPTETERSRTSDEQAESKPIVGLVCVWRGHRPQCRPIAVQQELTLGREHAQLVDFDDSKMSRRHCSIVYENAQWRVRDLGSRNGTYVDGRGIGEQWAGDFRVLRAGRSLFLPVLDVNPFAAGVQDLADGIVGPRLRAVYDQIVAAASISTTLLVMGSTGSGKELAARHFHRHGPGRNGPFIAVNCAAIPEGLAERVLFGTVRGAYSGAQADASGYVQAAEGGVLFLDEIGELDLEVQAKLLRFLETREVYAIGATRPRQLDIRVCFATHRNLREMTWEGRFREDLYFRINQPAVALPPLARRPEELPWLITRALAELPGAPKAHVQFVEACLLRSWPGNVRELLGAVRVAAQRAALGGHHEIDAEMLDAQAGMAMMRGAISTESPPEKPPPILKNRLDDEALVRATLARCQGKVMQAARELGVHRNQLRRWIADHGGTPDSD